LTPAKTRMVSSAASILQLLPGSDTNASLSMNASDAPGWPAILDNHLAAWVPWDGVSLILDLVLLQAAIGLGVLAGRRTRRAAVLGAAPSRQVREVHESSRTTRGGSWPRPRSRLPVRAAKHEAYR
jgi:hypothetical protein